MKPVSVSMIAARTRALDFDAEHLVLLFVGEFVRAARLARAAAAVVRFCRGSERRRRGNPNPNRRGACNHGVSLTAAAAQKKSAAPEKKSAMPTLALERTKANPKRLKSRAAPAFFFVLFAASHAFAQAQKDAPATVAGRVMNGDHGAAGISVMLMQTEQPARSRTVVRA